MCAFHRDQAWNRWLSKSSNGYRSRPNDIKKLLWDIVEAGNEDELKKAIDTLKTSEFYLKPQYRQFKTYMENTWMPESVQEVTAFFNPEKIRFWPKLPF